MGQSSGDLNDLNILTLCSRISQRRNKTCDFSEIKKL